MEKIWKIALVVVIALFVLYQCFWNSDEDEYKASATIPDGTENAVVLRYKKNNEKSVTVTFSVEGDVNFAGVAGYIEYNPYALKYESFYQICESVYVNEAEQGKIYFAFASDANIIEEGMLFSLDFSFDVGYRGDTQLKAYIKEEDFCDAFYENVKFTVFDLNIEL